MERITIVSLDGITHLPREKVSVSELIPNALEENSPLFVELLEHYYNYLNSEGLPGDIVTRLFEQRDVDFCTEDSLAKLKGTLLPNYPNEYHLDEKTILKNSIAFFRQKGSSESIKNFFRTFYGSDDASVYYPWEDVLIPSSGTWVGNTLSKITLDGVVSTLKGFVLSKGSFSSNKGFLSDKIYLQDSYYYQRYSYDIKTSVTRSVWEGIFEKILHPAGFKRFVSVAILIYLYEVYGSMMPEIQFGKIIGLDNVIFRLFQIVGDPVSVHTTATELFHQIRVVYNTFENEWATRLLFYEPAPMSVFDYLTIEELDGNVININIGSLITQLAPSPPP